MIDMLKRHEIQVLRRAGHTQTEIAKLAGVSRRSVQRVGPSRTSRPAWSASGAGLADPRRRSPFRSFVATLLTPEPELLSVEVLRRAKLAGYTGAKTALHELIRDLRPTTIRPLVRFEGPAGEFSQHDFGHVDVHFSMA